MLLSRNAPRSYEGRGRFDGFPPMSSTASRNAAASSHRSRECSVARRRARSTNSFGMTLAYARIGTCSQGRVTIGVSVSWPRNLASGARHCGRALTPLLRATTERRVRVTRKAADKAGKKFLSWYLTCSAAAGIIRTCGPVLCTTKGGRHCVGCVQSFRTCPARSCTNRPAARAPGGEGVRQCADSLGRS